MELLELLEEKSIRFEKIHFIKEEFRFMKEKEMMLIIHKNVDISNTPVKELPLNSIIIFNGYADISNTLIKELPDYTIVNGDLYINNTLITKIPKNVIADSIFTPVKTRCPIYIKKNGIIGVGVEEHGIEEWEKEIFKDRKRLYSPYYNLTSKEYDMVIKDFKTAVNLLESWNS